jgi:pseudaminic acid synthase
MTFSIAGRPIGPGHPTFIIAELSANHNQRIEIALETIRAAKAAGADAIKLQTYTADTITLKSDKPWFRIQGGTLWDGRTLHDLYQEAYTPWEWHAELFAEAKKQGLICFSSPFDPTAVDLLEQLETPAYKVASFEITDIPLIKLIGSKGKPVIFSTGIAELEDIELALEALRSTGNQQIAILQCTSAYPAPVEESNLIMIRDFAERFGVVAGLSDHTLGTTVPVVSVAMGASIIEKHFILDPAMGGPDAAFSLSPEQFRQMVDSVREAEKAIGKVTYALSEKQRKGRVFSRSLFAVEDIPAGMPFTPHNVRSIRPGNGMHPRHYMELLGRTAKVDIERGTPLEWGMVER